MVKSYLLQEAEAISREAKLRWAIANNERVVSLQHDGVVIKMDATNKKKIEEITEALKVEATRECGYEVAIKGKALG